MLRAHRQAWCWQDEYYGLQLEDIRRLELETQLALQEKMAGCNEEEGGETAPAQSQSNNKNTDNSNSMSSGGGGVSDNVTATSSAGHSGPRGGNVNLNDGTSKSVLQNSKSLEQVRLTPGSTQTSSHSTKSKSKSMSKTSLGEWYL